MPSPPFATQTEPRARPRCPRGGADRMRAERLAGAEVQPRDAVAARVRDPHGAEALGEAVRLRTDPDGSPSTRRDCAFTRVTVFRSRFATHTKPPPVATPSAPGCSGMGSSAVGLRACGSLGVRRRLEPEPEPEPSEPPEARTTTMATRARAPAAAAINPTGTRRRGRHVQCPSLKRRARGWVGAGAVGAGSVGAGSAAGSVAAGSVGAGSVVGGVGAGWDRRLRRQGRRNRRSPECRRPPPAAPPTRMPSGPGRPAPSPSPAIASSARASGTVSFSSRASGTGALRCANIFAASCRAGTGTLPVSAWKSTQPSA